MKDKKKSDAIYIVPDSVRERKRLQEQADILNPFTVRLFENAGICEGMRVLDVGSGAGDVAFAAAELVGPNGSVIGVDRIIFELQLVDNEGYSRSCGIKIGHWLLGFFDPIVSVVWQEDIFGRLNN